MTKHSKRGHFGSINVFTNQKFQKSNGYHLKEFEIFQKKSHCAEKKPKGDPLVSPLLLEALKNCDLVRESNPRSPRFQKNS